MPRNDVEEQALNDEVARDLDLLPDHKSDEEVPNLVDDEQPDDDQEAVEEGDDPPVELHEVHVPDDIVSLPVRPPEGQSARIAAGAKRPCKYYNAYRTSVKKGLEEHGTHAYQAIVKELKQLIREKKKTMSPVHRGDVSPTALKKVIRSFMFLKTKFDGMGRFEKIKARLVANGAQQDRKLYDNISSPTAMMQCILMCLTIAAKRGQNPSTIDIGGAYRHDWRGSVDGAGAHPNRDVDKKGT